jgi:3-mercaptopyruvate sulfurtransferase SseA
MRPAAEIARMWRASGIHAGLHVGFYCGTGWRASLAFFYAWLMGWERIAVYDGGWYEWSLDPANPVVCRVAESLSA